MNFHQLFRHPLGRMFISSLQLFAFCAQAHLCVATGKGVPLQGGLVEHICQSTCDLHCCSRPHRSSTPTSPPTPPGFLRTRRPTEAGCQGFSGFGWGSNGQRNAFRLRPPLRPYDDKDVRVRKASMQPSFGVPMQRDGSLTWINGLAIHNLCCTMQVTKSHASTPCS